MAAMLCYGSAPVMMELGHLSRFVVNTGHVSACNPSKFRATSSYTHL